ncbi:hypothetical protein [Serratia quinivorans]|uniref:hypothetical protein n=1 Tax=Serratia quinivorans TaxID=137545 RepID=UPI00217C62A2|nr:hypothetical protein [Serratia quinivorans]CAI1715788.1 Uncharacterised protein [Serratia quinivorans]CAI1799465.1 Uncharacterised protein [Serratia quinivorans]
MSIFESIVDSLKTQLAERQAHDAEQSSISKAKDGLAETIAEHIKKQTEQTVQLAVVEEPATPAEDIAKGRKIKSKGIALTHKDQGGPANGRSVSLLMKSSGQQNIKRQQLISKASVPVFIRKANGELLSPSGQLITESLMKTIRKLNIEFTIQEEQSGQSL